MPEPVTALLALWNDVDPALDAQYNAWHADEHVPERCTVPGIVWGRRYRLAAVGDMPHYLTLYGLADAQVLDSEPYQRLLREPTPASRRMRPALRNVWRWVCDLRHCDPLDAAGLLWVKSFPDGAAPRVPATPGGWLLAERSAAASPLPWLSAGQSSAVEGQWLLCWAPDPALRAAPPDGTAAYARLR